MNTKKNYCTDCKKNVREDICIEHIEMLQKVRKFGKKIKESAVMKPLTGWLIFLREERPNVI